MGLVLHEHGHFGGHSHGHSHSHSHDHESGSNVSGAEEGKISDFTHAVNT